MDWVMGFILGVRRIKGEMNIPPGKPLPILLGHTSAQDRDWAVRHRPYLDFLARTESITVLPESDEGPEAATALVGGMKVLSPLAGLIDKDAELTRLGKEIARLQAELERIAAKLGNPSFTEKAPAAVVEKERERLASNRAAIEKLDAQAAKIRAL
jgi:valyl-tRNA synthetase